MIPVIDCWVDHEPPVGAADDDELLEAAGEEAIIIGDRGAAHRARQMGVDVVAHLAVRSPAATSRAALRRRLRAFDRHRLTPRSIWTAGLVTEPLERAPASRPPAPARPVCTLRPFVLPLASSPRAIDACTIVTAQALLEAGGTTALLALPPGSSQLGRARRRLAKADRTLSVEAVAFPGARYIATADLVVDFGINAGGAIERAARGSGVPIVDATRALTPLSVAVCIRHGLGAETHR